MIRRLKLLDEINEVKSAFENNGGTLTEETKAQAINLIKRVYAIVHSFLNLKTPAYKFTLFEETFNQTSSYPIQTNGMQTEKALLDLLKTMNNKIKSPKSLLEINRTFYDERIGLAKALAIFIVEKQIGEKQESSVYSKALGVVENLSKDKNVALYNVKEFSEKFESAIKNNEIESDWVLIDKPTV